MVARNYMPYFNPLINMMLLPCFETFYGCLLEINQSYMYEAPKKVNMGDHSRAVLLGVGFRICVSFAELSFIILNKNVIRRNFNDRYISVHEIHILSFLETMVKDGVRLTIWMSSHLWQLLKYSIQSSLETLENIWTCSPLFKVIIPMKRIPLTCIVLADETPV